MTSFRDLHVPGQPLVMPNPWDRGSALLLASLGYRALATTSAGFANATGRPDAARAVTAREAIHHAVDLSEATGLPVNADLERCGADDPAGVAATIAAAVTVGVAGGSIEDVTGEPGDPVYSFDRAVERVAAAATAAHAAESDFVLTARADGVLWGAYDIGEAIRRMQAFVSVGADVVYAPGLADLEAVALVTRSVDAPVNVLPSADMTVDLLATAGVARISVGSHMFRAAYGRLLEAGRELATDGTFRFAETSVSTRRMNRIVQS